MFAKSLKVSPYSIKSSTSDSMTQTDLQLEWPEECLSLEAENHNDEELPCPYEDGIDLDPE